MNHSTDRESLIDDTQYAVFPLKFIEDLYKIFLYFNSEFITPDNLSFLITDEILFPQTIDNIYKREYNSWKKCSPQNKFSILLLHDCDEAPYNTIRFLEYEKSLGITSTTSLYVTHFDNDEEYPFPLDYSKLATLQDMGFCFTYHWNQVGNDNFDPTCYWSFFDDDVDFLRAKGLRINYYSSHGWKRSKQGKCNHDFFCPAMAKNKLLSTHNRYRIIGLSYSDGGFGSRPENSDIRKFLTQLTYGERHIILLHPCIYGAKDDTYAKKFFETHPFIKEYWHFFHAGDTTPYWKNVLKVLSRKKAMLSSR